MSKAAKKSIWITAIALLLIGIAMWLRYISRSIDGTYGITQIRSGIYIILLSAWGGIRSKPYYSGADTPLSAGHIRTDDFLAGASHGQIFSEHDGSAPLSVVWVLYSPAVYSVIVHVGCQVFGKTAGLSHSFQ